MKLHGLRTEELSVLKPANRADFSETKKGGFVPPFFCGSFHRKDANNAKLAQRGSLGGGHYRGSSLRRDNVPNSHKGVTSLL